MIWGQRASISTVRRPRRSRGSRERVARRYRPRPLRRVWVRKFGRQTEIRALIDAAEDGVAFYRVCRRCRTMARSLGRLPPDRDPQYRTL